MVKFTEIINASMEWTATLLFRPFQVKKWLLLTFIALMAGYMGGGSNFNFNLPSREDYHRRKPLTNDATVQPLMFEAGPSETKVQTQADNILRAISRGLKNPIIIIIIALFLVPLFILFTWLWSRFTFIFLEDVALNTASIRAPFHKHKDIAHSLFLFSLALTVVFVLLVGLLLLGFAYRLGKLILLYKAAEIGFLGLCAPQHNRLMGESPIKLFDVGEDL